MNNKDKLRFVRQNMSKNKMRLFMTVLATAMSCSFLIVLASVGFGLHETLLKNVMEQQAINEISIHGSSDADDHYQGITIQDVDYFKSLENVRAVTKTIYLNQYPEVTLDEHVIHANTQTADFTASQQAGMELSAGAFPKEDNEILVGYHFKEHLFPIGDEDNEDMLDQSGELSLDYQYTESLVGKTVLIAIEKLVENDEFETETFEAVISGVKAEPSREWEVDTDILISEDMLVLMENYTGTPNASLYWSDEDDIYQDQAGDFDNVTIHSYSLQHVEVLSALLQDEGYYVYSVANELKEINIIFTIAKSGLIFIGTIAVLIASIGIYNTMTMAVTERAPDIGIMKAIGANPKTIKQIFLLESTCIGLLGALIGTIVAYLISFTVNLVIPLILEGVFQEQLPDGLKFSAIPWTLVTIAVGICLVVTILSGARPAKKATKIDVLKAMRREI